MFSSAILFTLNIQVQKFLIIIMSHSLGLLQLKPENNDNKEKHQRL